MLDLLVSMLDWKILILTNILGFGFYALFLKKLTSKVHPMAMMFLINLTSLPFVFLINRGYPPLSLIWVFPVVSGALYAVTNFLSFKSFAEGDISLVAPLNTLASVFVLVLSIILLREAITVQKVVGVLLIFFGMGFLDRSGNLFESLRAMTKNRIVRYMTLATFFGAMANIIDKFSLNYFDQFSYPALVFVAVAVIAGAYLALFRRKKIGELRSSIGETWKHFLGASLCVVTGYISFIIVISQIDVSIASPISSMSIFVTIALGKFVLKEKTSNRWVAAVVMVLGAALLLMPQFF